MKNKTAVIIILLLFTLTAYFTCYAKTEYNAALPYNCNNMSCDTNNNGAFLIGFKDNYLYCTKALPEFTSRQITTDGKIKSVCQCDKYTYALAYKSASYNYFQLFEFDVCSGKYKYYNISNSDAIDTKYIAVSENRLFTLMTDDVRAYVKAISLSDKKEFNFKFNNNVIKIFGNNNTAYAVLYDGSIYKLSGNKSYYCTTINSKSKINNAGANLIYDGNGKLISLNDDSNKYIYNTDNYCIFTSENHIFYSINNTAYCVTGNDTKTLNLSKNIKAIVSYKNKSAIFTDDNKCTVISFEEYKSDASKTRLSNNQSGYNINSKGILYNVESKTSVTAFKSKFPNTVVVYDSNNNPVSKGNIKTGYLLKYNGDIYKIAVKGDITNEGNVKSNDTKKLMRYFCNLDNLSSLHMTAADYNLDENVDNKDLVLISRKSKD